MTATDFRTRRRKAVFLDRDGVLIEDHGPLVHADDIRVPQQTAEALALLKARGYLLIVVSNQTAVARGLIDEARVRLLQSEVEQRLQALGAPLVDDFLFCPHHPNATLVAYRQACECRKPAPGLLLAAQLRHDVDLGASFLVGDRASDILAGKRAGCRTVLLRSGRHLDAPIEVSGGFDPVAADLGCDDLLAAAQAILACDPEPVRVSA